MNSSAWPVRLFVGAALALLLGFLVHKLSWVEIEVSTPRTGAAAKPYYTLRQVAQATGTSVVERTMLEPLPPPGATLLLESRFWDLFPERDDALHRWVDGGGQLVVLQREIPEHRLAWVPPTYLHHAVSKPHRHADGAASAASDNDDADDTDDDQDDPDAKKSAPVARPRVASRLGPLFGRQEEPVCETLLEAPGSRAAFEPGRAYSRCLRPSVRPGCVDPTLRRHPRATPSWELGSVERPYAMRVAVGRGSVTAVAECLPLDNDAVLLGDHALIDAAVLGLRPGATLWIVDDEAGEPLPAWLWRHARAPLLLALAATLLALWRLMVRFGPREAPPGPARRSMGEQVRGTGQFIADTDPQALHAATRRAFDDAAATRIEGWAALDDEARAAAVAALLAPHHPLDAAALLAALGAFPRTTPAQWLAAIDILEQARRALLRSAAANPSARS